MKAGELHFGKGCQVIFNSSKDYAIIISDQKSAEPIAPMDYAIYNVKTDKIIFEEQKRGGSVEWKNNDYIIVKSKPEVQSIQPEQNKRMSVYYINVKTLETVYELKEE